ncbi:formate dehydrogenase accessory sulfurtransferase FdhD [Vibrio caribbeanicus]|uniref:formate dehydrogenase accessory sulfurtransferase FdhD n=1 Tax=Vibrio caribbeanicus TaxID=701175 RepID=UPI002284E66F|nr:formate dehydrogenase accessory sulfurtransferase FdhD [Vibrio caribbeanicus]MCY9844320.1 formate dehydrogenase accessory sulfurtransferase FdhD [Vibrio caribbeanicus]
MIKTKTQASNNSIKEVHRLYVSQHQSQPQVDTVIVEEPLTLWLHQEHHNNEKEQHWFSTMRTPGQDEALITGLLLSERIIHSSNQILSIHHEANNPHSAIVELSPDVHIDDLQTQRQTSHSSCGLCGKSLISLLEMRGFTAVESTSAWLTHTLVVSLPDKLRQRQNLFDITGASHSCALFDQLGDCLSIAEDAGRHNALDKLIGMCTKLNIPNMSQSIAVLSGRVSVEMMQKVIAAQIPVVIAVGAPTQLAVQMAQRFNITLIGFCKKQTFNLYSGAQRLIREQTNPPRENSRRDH